MKDQIPLLSSENEQHRIRVTLLVIVGAFLSTLNNGFCFFSIPVIASQFSVPWTYTGWSLVLYFLVIGSTLGIAYQMAIRFGSMRVHRAGLLLFFLGSVACAFSHGWLQLIAFRVVQALGAACLQATVVSLVIEYVSPPYHKKTMGLIGFFFVLGVFFGFLLAGWLNWHVMFGLLGCLALVFYLVSRPVKNFLSQPTQPIDLLSAFFLLSMLISFCLAISTASFHSASFHMVRLLFLISLVSFVIFFLLSSDTSRSLVSLSQFQNLTLFVSVLSKLTHSFFVVAIFVLIPIKFFLIDRFDVWYVPIICALPAFGLLVATLLGRKIIRQEHNSGVMIIGGVIALSCMFYFLQLKTPELHGMAQNVWSPLAHTIYCSALFLFGLGGGLMQNSINKAALQFDQKNPIRYFTLINVANNIGAGVGMTVVLYYLEKYLHYPGGLFFAFNKIVIFVSLAVIISLILAVVEVILLTVQDRRRRL